jgi:lipopolysaccharide transport system ATP-binding protein
MSVVIQVNGLTKEYRISKMRRGYSTLREAIARSAKGIFQSRNGNAKSTIFRALDDVSFEVKSGEVLGLIGRNGAGKSTLLKILSRITEPTHGSADLEGRVGSLLEVGTGFHGELTGRENIYLNGAILGIRRESVKRQFDSIVSFAEVEKFVDTPVKHYSSGMYLRLAFAVAAHLDPEILLIDEVLAVGDVSFQKKCLGKMGEVARQGRTIIFVSHNMGAIRALCTRGVVLENGRVFHTGHIGSSIEAYYKLSSLADTQDEEDPTRTGFGQVQVVSHPSTTIQQDDSFAVATTLNFSGEVAGFSLLFILQDMQQRNIIHFRRDSPDLISDHVWNGMHKVTIKLPPLSLEPGLYSMHFKALLWGSQERERIVSDPLHLDVGGEACGWGAILAPKAELTVQPQTFSEIQSIAAVHSNGQE